MVGLALLSASLDRLVKYLAVKSPTRGSGAFGFGYDLNTAGPLSLPLPSPVLMVLGLFALVAVVAVAVRALRTSDSRSLMGALLVLVGGASNVFDRLVFGGVVDTFWLVGWGTLWFNLADVYLVVGLGVLLTHAVHPRLVKSEPRV